MLIQESELRYLIRKELIKESYRSNYHLRSNYSLNQYEAALLNEIAMQDFTNAFKKVKAGSKRFLSKVKSKGKQAVAVAGLLSMVGCIGNPGDPDEAAHMFAQASEPIQHEVARVMNDIALQVARDKGAQKAITLTLDDIANLEDGGVQEFGQGGHTTEEIKGAKEAAKSMCEILDDELQNMGTPRKEGGSKYGPIDPRVMNIFSTACGIPVGLAEF